MGFSGLGLLAGFSLAGLGFGSVFGGGFGKRSWIVPVGGGNI